MYFIELLNFDSLIYRRLQILFFAKQILKVFMLYFFFYFHHTADKTSNEHFNREVQRV